ncbi:response regulator [Leptolyngbya ohadii]|uniref:response regulator n=1 Tax=Leptolyngbya ohadii TaxID=1962290 RepID=UPI000B5A17E2|nr:response regulator [Leptolyngbya ohadii]
MKALLIEDDRAIGDILTDALSSHYWVVERAWDGELGLELTSVQEYDLILLDIGLPKVDGITVCKQLRSRGCQTPVLLLTGQNSAEAQIAGLDAGADDYITKPFNLDIVLARVRAVVRKGKSAAPIVTWENIQLDPARGEVRCDDKVINLRAKEFGLLELFLLTPKRIFSRRAILDHLWDSAHSSGEETVSTHVKCVRQKLKAAGASDPIETVHGLGYRLRSPRTDPTLPLQAEKAPSTSGLSLSTSDQKAQAVTSKVWNQFKTQYAEQIQTLGTLIHALKPAVASSQQQECKDLAHKLVGSMGMFGLIDASQRARDLEQVMKVSFLKAEQIEEAIQAVEFLKQAIAQAQVTPPPKTQSLPTPNTFSHSFTQILIVDDDLLLADRLRIEAIAWHLQVEIATDLTVARQMIAQHPPNVILLDLSFPGEESGLTLMQELEQRSLKIPVVIFTAKENLRDRIAAARLGVSAFLQKPIPAHEILKTVTDVLNRNSHFPQTDRLLIVDDDPGFLKALSERLSERGLQVTTTADPQSFWQTLTSCSPNVLILDLEMPEFDGVELCQVVRADPKWQHLKVLFLSAHTEAEMINKAYAAGADDYISKSALGNDLVTRILYRVGRN